MSASALGPGGDGAEGCLVRIRRVLASLEGARRAVAEYVLAAEWGAVGLSITELADRCGVSENAVTRLTHALGYSGYRAFSHALLVDMGRATGVGHAHPSEIVSHAAENDGNPVALVRRVLDLELSCLRDTLASLDEERIQGAIDALAAADRILLIGTGSPAPLCQMMQYRLSNLGLRATWTNDPMVMVSEASLLGPRDVVLGVTYDGRARTTTEVLDYARTTRRATTICLTAVAGSPVTRVTDIALVVFGPKMPMGNAQFSARVSSMALLDALATAVAVKKHGATVPTLQGFLDAQVRINNVGPGWKPARTRGEPPADQSRKVSSTDE